MPIPMPHLSYLPALPLCLALQNTVWQRKVDTVADQQYWAGTGARLASGAPPLTELSRQVGL